MTEDHNPCKLENKKVTYELYNANGWEKKAESASSNQTEKLNMNSLVPGFYIVKIT